MPKISIFDTDTDPARGLSGLNEQELNELENFCARNDLSFINRLCAEVRIMRNMYLQQCAEVGRLRGQIRSPDRHAT